ncbi:MAG TPA: hypothetical protein VK921_10590 [Anditalea sp.]|nr:hypothetical protein [Anditalea sp.]
MNKSINIKVGFETFKSSILELSFSEKRELLELLKDDLSKVEVEEPMTNYILSESSLEKEWNKKEENEAWDHL